MKCIRCNRPLDAPTVWIRTRSGPAAYGPKCARIAGLWPAKHERRPVRARTKAAPLDECQMTLELTP